ncbi:MAG: chemotaxis-specific protein-glutamate methyltransferase CheB [Polyangiales bacterium]
MDARIRALVVDDSAFARKVVREILQADGIEVVAIARDGLEALEQIQLHQLDVVVLDLMMPNLDGLGVLRLLRDLDLASGPAPRVVVVSVAEVDSALTVEALQQGAVSAVRKPTALATARLYELKGDLVRAVREAALARSSLSGGSPTLALAPTLRPSRHRLVVIGTSTGGPQALTRLLAALPAGFPVPIAIALHIPFGYTEELAKRLDRSSAIDVSEAEEGLRLRPGLAVLARGGQHLVLTNRVEPTVHLSSEPLTELHKPSVDTLFESAAACVGSGVLGVVLTGMGSDGLRGAHAIKAAGGRILTEAASSCVVYGMPGVVKEAGLSDAEAPLDDMARLIIAHL